MIGGTRVVNAGSVGSPIGKPGAYWVLLGPDVELRHTIYDLGKTARHFRTTEHPHADEVAESILQPPAEEPMLELFARAEVKPVPSDSGH
jgi:hypothetical protein